MDASLIAAIAFAIMVAFIIMSATGIVLCIAKSRANSDMKRCAELAVALVDDEYMKAARESGKDMDEAEKSAKSLAEKSTVAIASPSTRFFAKMSFGDFDMYVAALVSEQYTRNGTK